MAGSKNDVVVGKNADFSQAGAPNAATSEANGLATNGQLWIGATLTNVGGTHINVGSIVSPDASLNIGYSSPNITLAVAGGTTTGKTITGDTGGALSPTGGNWNILGGPGVTTSGSGSTLTINSVVFTNTTATTLAVDNGYNATAAGTYNMPATAAQGEMIIVFCDTAGAVVLDCPALNFIRIGNAITSSGGTATSTLQGDSLTLRYRLSSLTWEAVSVSGNWLLA